MTYPTMSEAERRDWTRWHTPPKNKKVVMAESYRELRSSYPNLNAFAIHLSRLSGDPGSQFSTPMPTTVVARVGTVEYAADVDERGNILWNRLSGYGKKLASMGEKYGARNPKSKLRVNPIYKLTVTAPDEASARAKGRRFGRVVAVKRGAKGKYAVTVDQAALGNPGLLPWLSSAQQQRWKSMTDVELREEMSGIRQEISYDKASLQKAGKLPTMQRMIEYGDPSEILEDIELHKEDIQVIKAILEARKAERRAKREAKKPKRLPKAPVMRRRAGTTTRANPKRAKNVRDLVREALK